MEFMDEMGSVVFESIAKSTSAYIYAINGSTDISRWSRNAVDNFELPGEYVQNATGIWGKLVHPEDYHIWQEDIDKVFGGIKDNHHCEYRIKKRTGEYVWIRCRGYATRNPDGSLAWFIGLIRELASLNKVDYTTQLLSIYEFRRTLELYLKTAMTDGGVLLVGADNFKKINTMYSYSFGNQVLLKAAELFQNLCPPNVKLYRIEGDKFAFICPHCTRREIEQLFATVSSGIMNLELSDRERVALSFSGGALMLDRIYGSIDEIHKDLEHALSLSKQNVSGTLTFFSEELLEESLRELHLREELRRCVENGCEDFVLYFQPIIKSGTHKLYSCEALLRWNNKKFPGIYPDRFIPILEETGLITQVGKWVGETALSYLKQWRNSLPDLKVNVNVSYVQIKEGSLQDAVRKSLEKVELPPECLVLEITESCDVKDMESARKFVNDIRSLGIEIALDDFGTGYSSISVLQKIPTDWIKLDHNFVSKITDNQFDRNIVQYLINLCHSLDYKVCVEGVEDKMCYELVQNQNAETVQGYFFSRPIPADEFAARYIVKE